MSSPMNGESQIAFQRQGEYSSESFEMIVSVILPVLEVLIFDDCCQNLDSIPLDVKLSAFKNLQIIWKWLRDKSRPMVPGESIVPKLIVWLAVDQEASSGVDYCHRKLCKSLLGGLDTNSQHFWTKHWECLPLLVKEGVDGGETRANLLGKALHTEDGSLLLRGILTRALACPPFCADELEPSVIFEEIKGKLGQSLILGQDIRLVKSVHAECCSTQANTEENYHKFASGGSKMEDAPISVDTQTCLDAYELGYTVALRGMEFRYPQVAAMTEALSICFGQATVGANMYITPPNARGLTLHYDDHCVLVWQLSGSKCWKLFSPKNILPRLYSSIESIQNNNICNKEILSLRLMEGDIVYIPRGFPHEANTKQEYFEQQRSLESGSQWSESRDCVQDEVKFGRFLDVSTILQDSCIFDGNPRKRSCSENSVINVKAVEHSESSILMNHDGQDLKFPCNCMDQMKGYGGTCTSDPVHSLHVTFGVEVEPPFELMTVTLDLIKGRRIEFVEECAGGAVLVKICKGHIIPCCCHIYSAT